MCDDSLFKSLEHLIGARAVIVCVGNLLKADDGVGPLLYEKLSGKLAATVIDAATTPENYIQRIVGCAPDALIVVDAVDFGGSPGQVRLFEAGQLKSFTMSTHALSPAVFVEMISAQIPVRTYFIGVQPASTELGGPVCDEVACAINMLAELFVRLFPHP